MAGPGEDGPRSPPEVADRAASPGASGGASATDAQGQPPRLRPFEACTEGPFPSAPVSSRMQRSGLCPLAGSPSAVLERWAAALEAKDVDALAALYHRDATVLGFDVRLQGREDLRDAIAGPVRFLGRVKVHLGARRAGADGSIIREVTIESRLGCMRANHSLVVEDGLIRHHFIGTVHRDPGEHATA